MLSATLKDYIAAWNSHDVSEVMAFFDPSIIYEDVALKKVLTFDALRDFISGAVQRSPDLRFEIVSVCEGESMISWEWLMHRTRDGALVSTPGQSMTEFAGDKIVRNRDYWSSLPTTAE